MKWFDDEIEKEFERMRQRMEKMLGSPSRPGAATLCGDVGWRPSLDLYETDDKLIGLVIGVLSAYVGDPCIQGKVPEGVGPEAEVGAHRFKMVGICIPVMEGIVRIHLDQGDPVLNDVIKAFSLYLQGSITYVPFAGEGQVEIM